MREAPQCAESMGEDSANTLLYPQDPHSFTDLLPPHSDVARALVVTIEQSVDGWLSSNQDVHELVDELVVVSVGDGVRSTATARPDTTTTPTPAPLPGEPLIEFIPDPGDLAELGVTINAHLSEPPTNTNEQSQTVLYLDSITALLEATDTETVFRFLHTLTSLVKTRGATAYYELDPSQVDPETVLTLSALFDPNPHN